MPRRSLIVRYHVALLVRRCYFVRRGRRGTVCVLPVREGTDGAETDRRSCERDREAQGRRSVPATGSGWEDVYGSGYEREVRSGE